MAQRGYDVLIVGGGHGGASTALSLRRLGFGGSIAIVTREPDPPYERPPLTKGLLAGSKRFAELLIRPAEIWAELRIDVLKRREIVAIDASRRHIRTAEGDWLAYGALVWAAGGQPRRLSCRGKDLAGIHYVRTRADAEALRRSARQARNMVVIGGGYLGLEAAATLTGLGKSVSVVEAADRLLARTVGPELARFVEGVHRDRGVDIRLGARVECIEGSDGAVESVRLADGSRLPADLVVVGIGIEPCVGPLIEAGAAGDPEGVEIDDFCRTSLARVFALGDCVRHRHPAACGAAIRLESVQNANDQGLIVARALCDAPEPYTATPSFWSDQFELRLQSAGLAVGYDRLVVRGDMSTLGFSLVYLREGQVIALDCVGNPRDYAQGRQLIAASASVDPERLADPAVPLRSLLVAT